MRRHYLLLSFLMGFITAMGQPSSVTPFEKADIYFDNFDFLNSATLYQYGLNNRIDMKNRQEERYLISLIFTGKANDALTYIKKKVGSSKRNPYLFQVALAYHYSNDFEKAITLYKDFLKKESSSPYYEVASLNLRKAYKGELYKLADFYGIAENLGQAINTEADEKNLILSTQTQDRIYFNRIYPQTNQSVKTNIFVTENYNGEWVKPDMVYKELNKDANTWLVDINQQTRTIVYGVGEYQAYSNILIDSLLFNGKRSSVLLNAVFPMETGDRDFTFLRDSVVIFSGIRDEGFGGYDLYLSYFRNGRWNDPINLGPSINTTFDEISPFMATDGRTLYYSSNNEESVGGFDVFKSVFNEKNLSWSQRMNIGVGINSGADEIYFKLTDNGSMGYFSSNRIGGMGGYDLYRFYFNEPNKEQLILSYPEFFYQLDGYLKTVELQKNDAVIGENSSIEIQPLYYAGDNIMTTSNQTAISRIANFMKSNPSSSIVLVGHSSSGTNKDFDLFFTIKRVEKIAEFLQNNGVENKRIKLWSAGSNYPFIKENINGRANPMATTMNNRIDVYLIDDQYNTISQSQMVEVSEINIEGKGLQFKQNFESGFLYLQFVALRQMYSGALSGRNDILIYSEGGSSIYKYAIGPIKDIAEVQKINVELKKSGTTEIITLPFYLGIQVSPQNLDLDNIKNSQTIRGFFE